VSRTHTIAAVVGLAIALGGPALLVSPAHRLLGEPDRLTTRVVEQFALWLLLAVILGIVVLWERQPLSSIGVQPLRWQSLTWGAALAAALLWGVVPALAWALRSAGIAGFESGIAMIAALPVWFRVFAVVTAGVTEEALFRGYAVERLALLIGSYWLAGAISLAVFALVHLPLWGLGPVLTFVVTGGILTAFFIWRQDLLANIVAHVIVDGMGLVVMPLLSRTG